MSFDYESLEALVQRRAPEMMKQGGGSLERTGERRGPRTSAEDEVIHRMNAEGKSQRQIGEVLKVDQAQVSRWMKQMGLKPAHERNKNFDGRKQK